MMKKLYRGLLFFYPADYRAIFGTEMAETFDEMYAAACDQGTWHRMTFCLRELTGLVRAALYAQIRIHHSVLQAGRVKTIANGRAVVTPLILVFIAVLAAIEILKSFAFHRPHSRPIVSHEFPLAILEWLILAYGVGVIGWAITFLAHRTGIQRLAKMDTGSTEN